MVYDVSLALLWNIWIDGATYVHTMACQPRRRLAVASLSYKLCAQSTDMHPSAAKMRLHRSFDNTHITTYQNLKLDWIDKEVFAPRASHMRAAPGVFLPGCSHAYIKGTPLCGCPPVFSTWNSSAVQIAWYGDYVCRHSVSDQVEPFDFSKAIE
jgi:hypothetical protein